MEKKIFELEERLAELEKQIKAQPVNLQIDIGSNSNFADYLVKCVLQYQKSLTESIHCQR